jgi:hypothetical protein
MITLTLYHSYKSADCFISSLFWPWRIYGLVTEREREKDENTLLEEAVIC